MAQAMQDDGAKGSDQMTSRWEWLVATFVVVAAVAVGGDRLWTLSLPGGSGVIVRHSASPAALTLLQQMF